MSPIGLTKNRNVNEKISCVYMNDMDYHVIFLFAFTIAKTCPFHYLKVTNVIIPSNFHD